MDNLQPLVKHRFWVCCGFALILISLGWLLGTNSLAKEAADQASTIQGAISGIPNSDGHPNEDWTGILGKINGGRADVYEVKAQDLRKTQLSKMSWPINMAGMKDVPYFGKSSDVNLPTVYRTDYPTYKDGVVYDSVDPLKYDESKKQYIGRVLCDPAILPQVPEKTWWGRDPSWTEIWEAQEEQWMVKMLLESVNRVNNHRNARNIHEASVRQIVQIILRGGSRESGEGGSGDGTDGNPATSAAERNPAFAGTAGSGRSGAGISVNRGGGGGGGDANYQQSASLSTDHGDAVFGKQVPKPKADGEQPDGNGESTDGAVGDRTPMGTGTGGGYAGSGNSTGGNLSPYVDDDPEQPFKTRGFIIKVLMIRKDVPLLVRELTNTAATGFPVKIVLLEELSSNLDHTGANTVSQYRGSDEGRGDNNITDGNFQRSSRGGGDVPRGGDDGGAAAALPPPGGGTGGASGQDSSYFPMYSGSGDAKTDMATYKNALKSPGMGEVVIYGLIKIYRPVKSDKSDDKTGKTGGSGTETSPSTPDTTDKKQPPAKGGTKQSPPADTSPGKKPVAPQDKQPKKAKPDNTNPDKTKPDGKKPDGKKQNATGAVKNNAK